MSQPNIEPAESDDAAVLWRRQRAAAAPETYLVLLRNPRLAKLAAAALEELLAGQDRHGLALVPPVRGAAFAAWAASTESADRRRLGSWCAGNVPEGAAPVLIGLDENGLSGWLRQLGLAAYIGVPPGDGVLVGLGVLPGEPDQQGDSAAEPEDRVRLVSVSTAQELVEVVVAATASSVLTTVVPPLPAGAVVSAPDSTTTSVRSVGRSSLRQVLTSKPVRVGASGLAGALAFVGIAPAASAFAQTNASGSAVLPSTTSLSGSPSSLSGSMPAAAQQNLVKAMAAPRGRHRHAGSSTSIPIAGLSGVNPGGPMIPAASPGEFAASGISRLGRHRNHHGRAADPVAASGGSAIGAYPATETAYPLTGYPATASGAGITSAYPATAYPATAYPATAYPATAYPATAYPATAYPATASGAGITSAYPATAYPATASGAGVTSAYPATAYPATAYPATAYPATASGAGITSAYPATASGAGTTSSSPATPIVIPVRHHHHHGIGTGALSGSQSCDVTCQVLQYVDTMVVDLLALPRSETMANTAAVASQAGSANPAQSAVPAAASSSAVAQPAGSQSCDVSCQTTQDVDSMIADLLASPRHSGNSPTKDWGGQMMPYMGDPTSTPLAGLAVGPLGGVVQGGSNAAPQ